MAVLGLRLRAGYLFLAVVVGHILLISAQVNTATGVPIAEAVVFGVYSEVQRGIFAVANSVRGVWQGYVDLRDVRAENQALRRQLAAAQVQAQEQRALADRTRSLEAVLGLRDRTDLRTTAAAIIGSDATPDFRSVMIDKGTTDGLRTDMPVIAPAGIVGRVVVPGPRASKVQILVDRNAAAGALVERSRAQGVVVGSGERLLRMEYVSEVGDVVAGDVLVASGIDGIFPRGFAIGRVVGVRKSGTAYKEVLVEPAVDFSSLEDVLVVLAPGPADTGQEAPR
jgi:rod shape-determining protein MreC